MMGFLSSLTISAPLSFMISIASSAAVVRVNRSESYDMPLTWNPFGFTTQTSIGTPPQNVTSIVDWTWNSHYLVTTLCKGSPLNTFDCLAPGQSLFNQTKSSTFKNLSDQYPNQSWNPNHFFFNLDLKVQYASDVEIIGPSSKTVVRLQAGDTQFKQPFVQPFNGIFGLSPVFPERKSSAQSTFWQAWKAQQFPSPYIAFHYCYPGSPDVSKATCSGHDAIQTLGGCRHDLVKGAIEWYDVIAFPEINVVDFVYEPGFFDYWAIRVKEVSLGDEWQAINQTIGAAAVFDHASYGRGAAVSVNMYKNLVALTRSGSAAAKGPITLASPPNNGDQPFYEFDCNKTSSLPPIKYKFTGGRRTWKILPRDYISDLGNGTCVFNVRTLGDGDFIIGNFGETFAKDKIILMDFEKLRVGIADVKW